MDSPPDPCRARRWRVPTTRAPSGRSPRSPCPGPSPSTASFPKASGRRRARAASPSAILRTGSPPPSRRPSGWLSTATTSTSPPACSTPSQTRSPAASGGATRRPNPIWFDVGLDPYHDRRSGYYFGINPSGSIEDGTLANDEEFDATWDGVWESAARIDGLGWTVEIRIPFDQLRFKRREAYVWGINFQRIVKRKNEESHFAWVPKEESGLVSNFAELTGLVGIAAGRRLEISPFGLTQAELYPEEPGNPFRTGRDLGAGGGFDLEGGLSSNLTLNLSVNPDFGQVEVDPAVINITDEETYYEEKRPFFVEGASIFDFGRGGPNVYRSFGWDNPEIFYSRRIGRTPQGSPGGGGYFDMPDWTTILSAAKVAGKIGRDFNLGVISALTEREYARVDADGARSSVEVEPFSHYGVAQGLKEFGEGRSGLGFIATSVARDLREGDLGAALGQSALALGVDGWTFLDRDRGWALAGWAGLTEVRGSAEAITALQLSSLHYFQRPDADWVEVDESATSLSGWAARLYVNKQKGNVVFNAALGAISPGFEANDLGYHTRGDVVNGHLEAGYRILQPGPRLPQLDRHGLLLPQLRLRREPRRRVHLPRRQGQVPQLLDGDDPPRLRAAQVQPLPDPGRADRFLSGRRDRARYPRDRRPQAPRRPIQRVLPLSSERRLQLVARRGRHLEAQPELQPVGRAELHLAIFRGPVDPAGRRPPQDLDLRRPLRPLRRRPEDAARRDADRLDLHAAAEPAGLPPALSRRGRFQRLQGAPGGADLRLRLLRRRGFDHHLRERRLHGRSRRAGGPGRAVHLRRPGLQPQIAPGDGRPALGVPAGLDPLSRLDAEAGRLCPSGGFRVLAGHGRSLPGPRPEHLHAQGVLPLRALGGWGGIQFGARPQAFRARRSITEPG
ncbi:MAG: DUF5916 domain-containing protein [Candidatus Moduliflexus flocculans]|nr:DUF5916 domain-containing protein [Candidatus Moduliflexus flocculans]